MYNKDNYLKNAELSTEQNCNMIDGIPNNTALPIPPSIPVPEVKPLDKVKEQPPRKRGIHLHVMVTEDELDTIHQCMAKAGITTG